VDLQDPEAAGGIVDGHWMSANVLAGGETVTSTPDRERVAVGTA
jgi:hypothetical protein